MTTPSSAIPTWGWITFGIVVLALLVGDLLAHRRGHSASRSHAALWTGIWIAAGLLFNVFVWVVFGAVAAEEYLASYLLEKSLSLDNLFVFFVIFRSLDIPREHHHRVLFWGIFGALVFRALFIVAGVAAVERFEWMSYAFGAILLWAAYRTFQEDPAEPQRESRLIRWLSVHLPVSNNAHDGRFIAHANGRRVVTSLFVALVAIELTDIMFAIDSVAAALSVTRDRFVLYSSNVFAILGLRSLYLFLEQSIAQFEYLHYGLAAVLAFAALKLLLEPWVHVSPLASVAVIVTLVGASIGYSLREKRDRVPHA